MDTKGPKLLVAEDHDISRHLLQRHLINWGFDVVTANDGEQALNILTSDNAPTVALIDWMMPGMDGLEVCRQVRNRSSDYIYLIILTAKTDKKEMSLGFESGVDDYVIKPFDQDELRARVNVGMRVVDLERGLKNKVLDLESMLSQVKQLKSLLPICTHCKSIRDDKDYWRQIEEYIHAEVGSDFSHGICPDCFHEHHSEYVPISPDFSTE